VALQNRVWRRILAVRRDLQVRRQAHIRQEWCAWDVLDAVRREIARERRQVRWKAAG
jgi:hypothetical protein